MKNVLSLDLGDKTGWCIGDHSGVFNLKPKQGQSYGWRFVMLESYVNKLIEDFDIGIVTYEKAGGRHYSGVTAIARFEGVVMNLCEKHQIDYRPYRATEIKKFAKAYLQSKTGEVIKGQLNKAKMIYSAQQSFNLDIIDDNHADAIWLYYLTISEL